MLTWWPTGLAVQRGPAAQEARWPGVRNRLMSAPVSASTSSAAHRRQPGIDSACCSCSSHGASNSSITPDRRAMSASMASMRANIALSRAPCSGVKKSAPSRASASRPIFGRALPRASSASALGSRSPAMRRPMMSRPVIPCRSVITDETLIAADSRSVSARCFSRVRSAVRSRR